MKAIDLQNITFSYSKPGRAAENAKTLDIISLSIAPGEFVALLGESGAGKSTLARLLNALLLPASGTVLIDGMDTREDSQLWEIRRRVGLLFPEADIQIVGTTVAEDVAFGPENLGWPPETIFAAVESALLTVGMLEYGESAPYQLSDLQKLKVSLAGVLAMKPSCLVVDESTARLTPEGRTEFLALLRTLNREAGLTVVLLTSLAAEAGHADRIITLETGHISEERPASAIGVNTDRPLLPLAQNASKNPANSESLC